MSEDTNTDNSPDTTATNDARAEEYVAFEADRESEWAAYEASIADAIICDAYRADREADAR